MGLGYHAGMVGVGRARSGVKEGGGGVVDRAEVPAHLWPHF